MQRVICTEKEMKHLLKQFVRPLVLITMLIEFSTNLFASTGFEANGIYYYFISDSTVGVTYCDYSGTVIIPTSVQRKGKRIMLQKLVLVHSLVIQV